MGYILDTQHQTHPVSWKAAVWSALIAGAVFMMMEMILVATIGGGSLWGPPRMIAAMVMGTDVLSPPASFHFGILTVAMMVRFASALIYAFILAWFIRNLDTGASIVAGAVFGLMIYLINFHFVATMAFTWFETAQNWITLSSHIVFGAVLGWAYQRTEYRKY